MSWLRDIFSRPPMATRREAATSYGETIQRLATADDPIERARLAQLLATQIEAAFSGSANNVQVALWQVEERIRDRQGETNEMISQLVTDNRQTLGLLQSQEGAIAELRTAFQAVGDALSEITTWRIGVDTALQQSHSDRARLRRDVDTMARQLVNLDNDITAMLGMLGNILDVGMFESLPDGVLIVDADGTIYRANSALERMTGYKPHALVGRTVEELIPIVSRRIHVTHRLRYNVDPHPRPMGGGKVFSALRADGTNVPVEIGLAPWSIRGRRYTIAIVRDVSAREAIEEPEGT